MGLILFQYDCSFVLAALRRGEVDYLEHVAAAAETDFFRHLEPPRCLEPPDGAQPRATEKRGGSGLLYLASEIKLQGARVITPSRVCTVRRIEALPVPTG